MKSVEDFAREHNISVMEASRIMERVEETKAQPKEAPTFNKMKKAEIQEWLDKQGVEYDEEANVKKLKEIAQNAV